MSYKDKHRLAVCKRNPHYFEYDGKPIWLSGHSRLWPLAGWIPPTNPPLDNPLADSGRHLPPPGRTYRDEVTRLAESGGHLIRITPFYSYNWQRGNPIPWKQVAAGKFDLTQWDANFFEAFADFLSSCAENAGSQEASSPRRAPILVTIVRSSRYG